MGHPIAAALENININFCHYINVYERNVIAIEKTVEIAKEALKMQQELLKKVD